MRASARLIAIGTSVVIALVLVAGWFLGVSPLLGEAARADEERAQVESQNDALRAQLEQYREQYENREQYQRQLDLLRTIVPEDHELAGFYDHVAACGDASGALLDEITTPEPAGYAVPAEPSEDQPTPGATLQSHLFVSPVTITLDETVPDRANEFVRCLQRTPRLVLISSFTTALGSGGSATITAHVYRVIDPETLPSSAAPEGEDDEDAPEPEPTEPEPTEPEPTEPEPTEPEPTEPEPTGTPEP